MPRAIPRRTTAAIPPSSRWRRSPTRSPSAMIERSRTSRTGSRSRACLVTPKTCSATLGAMRALLVLVGLLGAACGRNEASGDPVGTVTAADIAREQARFDVERRPDKIVEALAIGPGSRVADVGAGAGLLTVHLARAVAPNGKVVATDIDGAVLDLLGQRLKLDHLDGVVERRQVGADKPGLEAGAYDAILLAEVDHYFADPAAWLREAS